MPAEETTLLLVRHAHAHCNVDGSWDGHESCRGLTPTGEAQAGALSRRLAHDLASGPPAILVSSEMLRAVETASAISRQLHDGAPPLRLCAVCERHPGPFEGQPLAEALSGRPDAWCPDGAENVVRFLHRVGHGLRRLAAEHTGRQIVVSTHGGVIAASFHVLVTGSQPPLPPLPPLAPLNASITEWRRGGDGYWSLVRYNDVEHLVS